ncbi:MAG: class I SAM-dependent methyltransferase [Saprospirales bacterium]|nr:MAG: class I SAM-dependent methyltransferase [Saprospirales bacterium]
MKTESYNPEQYWSEVAERIKIRENEGTEIAGDDEPYYRYKRNEFLKLLKSINFEQKKVLEIGCGPGGNLIEISNLNPSKLIGVDISSEMVDLARRNLPENIKVLKTNGTKLAFQDKSFDVAFTATVLQHNTNEKKLLELISEICRVSSERVFLFERIEKNVHGSELCLGRPISYYSKIMNKNGFDLVHKEHINIRISYYVCGAIRKLLNPRTRKEGQPLNKISIILQNLTLPFTKKLDKIFKSDYDIAKLEYKKL